MKFETLQSYCLAKQKATFDFPFDEETIVFRVNGRIFALAAISGRPLSVNLKCEPELAMQLREQYEAVKPGYHMNKKHWNTVTLDGSIPLREIYGMIDHSYDLVAAAGGRKR